MIDLEKEIQETYTTLVELNKPFHRIFSDSQHDKNVYLKVPATIIDYQTLGLMQISDLHKAIDYSITRVGSATLLRSLLQPLTSLELITAKQESVRELESNDILRNALTDYVTEFKDIERDLFMLLNGEIEHTFPYGPFKNAMKSGKKMSDAAKAIPKAETAYTNFIVDEIKSFGQSSAYKLMQGPIYRTFDGLKTKEEKSFFTPSWIFRPTTFSPAAMAAMSSPFVLSHMELISKEYLMPISMMVMISGMYIFQGKKIVDYSAIRQMASKTNKDQAFRNAVDSVGKVDELLSFVGYAKVMPHPMTMPIMTDEDKHYFVAKNLRNPIQAKGNQNYVPNDVNLKDVGLTFVSGPNSGGKTTICKTIGQNQILAQIGSYVVASDAKINIADKLAYQAPQFDSLQEEEGRFGTELKRTRDIFFQTSPKSLVVLDELAEGTTFAEKVEQSRIVLEGFYAIGNNTLLVTHNHELVDNFNERGIGQCWQVEFNGEKPTHRLMNGISRESHASRVAEKVGFSGEDIEKYLREKGYKSV